MSTLEATVQMLEKLPEEKLSVVFNLTERLLTDNVKKHLVPKSSDEIYGELEISREQSRSGKITKAHEVSSKLRDKYGL